jgi:hypothetical protein
MQSPAAGKVLAGVAGATGTGSIGVLASTPLRARAARQVPAGEWAVLIVLFGMTGLVTVLALILEHQRNKLEIKARERAAAAAAQLDKRRLDWYLTVLKKAAGEPGSAAAYRELINADALHQAVEKNGTRPEMHKKIVDQSAARTAISGGHISRMGTPPTP